jgi:sulfur carrier protein
MNLHINGEARTFADVLPQLSLASLIECLAMKPDRVAVELNRDIVPRDRWPQTLLKDGDRLEIVHFVGGGAGVEALLDGARSKTHAES